MKRLLFLVFRRKNYIISYFNVKPNGKFFINLAEGVGFEPTDTFVSPVFKTGAFGRSATPPLFIYFLLIENNISWPYWSSKNYLPHPELLPL